MRPLLNASTALLASLSLLVPSVLVAQTPADDQAEAEMPTPAEPALSESPAIEQLPVEATTETPAEVGNDISASDEPITAKDAQSEATPSASASASAEPPVEAPDELIVTEPTASDAPPPEQLSPDPDTAADPAPDMGTTEITSKQEPLPEPDESAAAPERSQDPTPQSGDNQAIEQPTQSNAAPAIEAEEESPLPPAANDEAEALKQALEQAAQDKAAPDDAGQPETAPVAESAPAPTSQPAPEELAPDLSTAPAPEADAVENDLAREAANPVEPAESEALKATLDKSATDADSSEQVWDFNVTEDSARSSDEDFLTSVARSLAQDDAPKAEDKDNKSRDLARLALAGMAGLAVGKMLSDNRKVALNTGDRLVVTLPDGSQQLIKDEDTLLFQPGSNVRTERYDDGSSITTVLRDDGSQVVTIRDANMNILRRAVQWPDGRSTMLIDDTNAAEPVVISKLPPPARPVDYRSTQNEEALREALMRESAIGRHFSLGQIRNIAQVRALVAPLDIQSITFDTGSAAITPDQAAQLSTLGRVIADTIRQNPDEIFMIEGYTDAIGSEASNLALSDRRAESVALALTEYFRVPPENMIVQGYGEQFLRIQTQEAERANRRVAVRRITDLLARN